MENRHRIWWLASYPKSGSTWIRMFINAYVTGFPIDINSAWQYFTGDLQPQMYQKTSVQPITELRDPDSIYYRPAVLLNYLYSSATRDVGLKTHHANVTLDGIPLIPSKLSKGALYIIRDPRDVVLSYADHFGTDIDKAIDFMAKNESIIYKDHYKIYHILGSWSSHVDSWTISNKTVRTEIVRYEDLLADPETYFRLVLRALGFDFNEEKFNFATEQTRFDRLSELEDKNGFHEKGKGKKFFRKGKSGQWQDELSVDQVKQIEKNHRHTMERWDYKCEICKKKKSLKITTVASGTVC